MNRSSSLVLSFGLTSISLAALGACSGPTSSASSSTSVATSVATSVMTTETFDATETTSSSSSSSSSSSAVVLAVAITGGRTSVVGDGGRPVVLVASLLGVTPEAFRDAFSGVTPARGAEPEAAQVQANKAVLLDALGPYGVTNSALDAASNAYRYSSANGETWAHRDATATATIDDGMVTVTVIDAGRGYTSTPDVIVTLADGSSVHGTATVVYTDDFETNGSIGSVTVR